MTCGHFKARKYTTDLTYTRIGTKPPARLAEASFAIIERHLPSVIGASNLLSWCSASLAMLGLQRGRSNQCGLHGWEA